MRKFKPGQKHVLSSRAHEKKKKKDSGAEPKMKLKKGGQKLGPTNGSEKNQPNPEIKTAVSD